VRTNITQAADPATWQVVIPEHEKDLLTSASALKVRRPAYSAADSDFLHTFRAARRLL
jgi:hypothetical protein